MYPPNAALLIGDKDECLRRCLNDIAPGILVYVLEPVNIPTNARIRVIDYQDLEYTMKCMKNKTDSVIIFNHNIDMVTNKDMIFMSQYKKNLII